MHHPWTGLLGGGLSGSLPNPSVVTDEAQLRLAARAFGPRTPTAAIPDPASDRLLGDVFGRRAMSGVIQDQVWSTIMTSVFARRSTSSLIPNEAQGAFFGRVFGLRATSNLIADPSQAYLSANVFGRRSVSAMPDPAEKLEKILSPAIFNRHDRSRAETEFLLAKRGDLFVGGSGGARRLPIGAVDTILTSDGTGPVWAVEKHDAVADGANQDFGAAILVLPIIIHGLDSTTLGKPNSGTRVLQEARLFLLTLTNSQNCDLNVYVGGALVMSLAFTTNAAPGALTPAEWTLPGITATNLQSIGFDIQPTGGPSLNIAIASLHTIWRQT